MDHFNEWVNKYLNFRYIPNRFWLGKLYIILWSCPNNFLDWHQKWTNCPKSLQHYVNSQSKRHIYPISFLLYINTFCWHLNKFSYRKMRHMLTRDQNFNNMWYCRAALVFCNKLLQFFYIYNIGKVYNCSEGVGKNHFHWFVFLN